MEPVKEKKTSRSSSLNEENKYQPVDCRNSGKPQCDALNVWGAAWEEWGKMLLQEKNEMKLAICNLEKQVYYGQVINAGLICNAGGPIVSGPGGPPTDTTQPPKPPFKP